MAHATLDEAEAAKAEIREVMDDEWRHLVECPGARVGCPTCGAA